MNRSPNDPYIKLAYCIVALASLKIDVDRAGEFGDLYETARDCLFEAFGAIGDVREAEGGHETALICQRDGASLHVIPSRLVHCVGDKDTYVEDEHELGGALGAIVVGGFEWCWAEMVDGAIAKAAAMLDESTAVPASTAARC